MQKALYIGMRTFLVLTTLLFTGTAAQFICAAAIPGGMANFSSIQAFMSIPTAGYILYFMVWAGLEALVLDSFP